jgi:hypothetical protein
VIVLVNSVEINFKIIKFLMFFGGIWLFFVVFNILFIRVSPTIFLEQKFPIFVGIVDTIL